MGPFLRKHGWWLALVLLVDVMLVVRFTRARRPAPDRLDMPPPRAADALVAPLSELAALTYPTRQTRLTDANLAAVFQPTASGNPESGMYGSVRTGYAGKQLVPRFHEGIDIAPLERDRQGRPTDDVHAIAPGTVALLHRTAGNSDYGKYVVLTHRDAVGIVYSLYAHLADVEPGLREGAAVAAGARLGLMGHTALDPVPLARAHLHLEIGLINNMYFLSWPGRKARTTPGGLYNGQNLLGVDPVGVYRAWEETGTFSLLDHLQRLPVAMELILAARRPPDFFDRYPALWEGGAFAGHALVVALSEGGVPLRGRTATSEETARLGRAAAAVLRVDREALGRNGRRLVVQRSGDWVLGPNGETWRGIFVHHP